MNDTTAEHFMIKKPHLSESVNPLHANRIPPPHHIYSLGHVRNIQQDGKKECGINNLSID